MVAAGLGARRSGWIGIAATVALCATGIVAVVGVATTAASSARTGAAVGRVLGATAAPAVAARAILIQHYRDLLPLSLYVPGLRLPRAPARPGSRELDVVSIKAPRVRLCWWGAACNLSGSRMQRSYAIPGFHVPWRRQALPVHDPAAGGRPGRSC